jgi:hypothetical protein
VSDTFKHKEKAKFNHGLIDWVLSHKRYTDRANKEMSEQIYQKNKIKDHDFKIDFKNELNESNS